MLAIIHTLELDLEDAERTIVLLKQENTGLFEAGKEQLKEAALVIKNLSANKDSADQNLCLLASEFEEIRQQWEDKKHARMQKNSSAALNKLNTEKLQMEKRLKHRIEELKENANSAFERIEILERYAIDLEKKYVNLGGHLNTLIRPYVFDALERH